MGRHLVQKHSILLRDRSHFGSRAVSDQGIYVRTFVVALLLGYAVPFWCHLFFTIVVCLHAFQFRFAEFNQPVNMARDPLLWLCAEMRVLGKRIMALEHKTAEPMDFKWNPQAPEFVPQTQTDKNEYLAKQLMELLKEVPQVQMPVTVQNQIPVPQTISRDMKLLKIDAIEVRCGEADMKLQAMSEAND